MCVFVSIPLKNEKTACNFEEQTNKQITKWIGVENPNCQLAVPMNVYEREEYSRSRVKLKKRL